MERTYTIPLRKQWRKTVRYRRAKKTVRAIREFLQRHMKGSDVKIGPFLNEEVWKHGMKNPPSRIRVNAYKNPEGMVLAELFGKPLVKEALKEEKKGIVDKLKETVMVKEEKPTEVVDEKKETKKSDVRSQKTVQAKQEPVKK